MPWPEEEEEFSTILSAITASTTPCFQQIMFSNFDGGLEDLSPFFEGYNGHVCAVHYQQKEKMWYSTKGGSLMGSLTLAVKYLASYVRFLWPKILLDILQYFRRKGKFVHS